MNRQARVKGQSVWINCGYRGLIETAEMMAAFERKDKITIQVRDEAEPDTIYEFIVEKVVSYKVTNPRQGA